MKRTSMASRRSLERGQFSWVTFVLLASLAVGGYLAAVWAPVYIVHYEVKQVVRGHMNMAVKDPDDARLVAAMCRKLAALDQRVETDAQGEPVKVPTVDVSPDDVTWERDASVKPPMLHVAFDYVRVVKYPFLDRVDERVMSVDFTQDIAIPDWGSAR